MFKLNRYKHNPILEPDYWWEVQGVYNPAVIFDSGQFHMVYRALGHDRSSRLGYATSKDGFRWQKSSRYPWIDVDLNDPQERLGIEDPRIVKIADTFYITHTSASVFSAKEPPHFPATTNVPWHVRVGLISTKDFKTYRRHGFILPDIDTRNAALFPEKINGQYALIHRIKTDVFLSYSRDMKSFDRGQLLFAHDSDEWQSKKIGICSPPIRLSRGWLATYHGVSQDNYYRLGMILMDLNDPHKILWRSSEPLLSPYMKYEKSGLVDNVIFATGLVDHADQLYIYYGAADAVVALATVEKEEVEAYFNHIL